MPLVPDQFAQWLAESRLMTPQQRVTRRRFLGATAATAGGMLMRGRMSL